MKNNTLHWHKIRLLHTQITEKIKHESCNCSYIFWKRKRFLDHIRVLSFWISFWIKRGNDSKKAEKRFLDHIRVLSFWISLWIKRGYGLKKAEKRFLDHIRVLSFRIKRGYDSKKAEKRFLKAIRPSVRPSVRHSSVRPSVRHPSVRPYPRFILTLVKSAVHC